MNRTAQRLARIERLAAAHAERIGAAIAFAWYDNGPGAARITAAAEAIDAWGVREFGVGLRGDDGTALWAAVQEAGRREELLKLLADYDAAIFSTAYRMEPRSPAAASRLLAPGWPVMAARWAMREEQQV